jgi:hypothetical protein
MVGAVHGARVTKRGFTAMEIFVSTARQVERFGDNIRG